MPIFDKYIQTCPPPPPILKCRYYAKYIYPAGYALGYLSQCNLLESPNGILTQFNDFNTPAQITGADGTTVLLMDIFGLQYQGGYVSYFGTLDDSLKHQVFVKLDITTPIDLHKAYGTPIWVQCPTCDLHCFEITIDLANAVKIQAIYLDAVKDINQLFFPLSSNPMNLTVPADVLYLENFIKGIMGTQSAVNVNVFPTYVVLNIYNVFTNYIELNSVLGGTYIMTEIPCP